ncbi:Eukaryotic sulfide quinone oxidoreductase [Purpureocillium takamizusanense]|uniref:Eukaryotic sulfide quinone oxidoreductase n=1 Tax=Purpureocillium takamizusanense TaxID=2060973 RepID=A0A9Q8QIC0_9HYPO|nr:Eukaryotic sulfide quinone oxidoreductase [Purpureocillium takamizusanense]UNI19364.1 Eukaryotic sulfide quinone oxidoreductase [Purpureocillium takamizusanense]
MPGPSSSMPLLCRGGGHPSSRSRLIVNKLPLLPVAAAANRRRASPPPSSYARHLATVSPVNPASRSHRVVVVGGGSAGLAISHQLLRSGRFAQGDIAVVDPAEWHHYQPGWTLVGGGLKFKEDLRRRLDSLVDANIRLYSRPVGAFAPDANELTLADGDKLTYDQLVVAPGVAINYGSVKGLPDALADPSAPISSIYGYDHCDKVFRTVDALRQGRAIFTQPAGVIKCAGAPQKIMWLALDHWKRAGLYNANNSDSPVQVSFATGLPVMFGVPKYSAKLDELRRQRGVEGLFQHDLVAVDGNQATFARPDGQQQVTRRFDLLHVVPKMGPHAFVKDSPLANEAGYVDVDDGTTRHKKYPNVWSAGDASSLPTSKTAAAITAEAPVLVRNLLRALDGQDPDALYDGYTSCPLLTEYGKVLLAEFKYGGVPKETFDGWLGIDQVEPRRAFYHLKKDFFPWVYYNSMVKGTWGGPKGWVN